MTRENRRWISWVAGVALLLGAIGTASALTMDIRRNATPEAYYVYILFRGAESADIFTAAQRGGVLISYQASKKKEEQFDNGGMWAYSAAQRMNSFVGIPPDGDLSRMHRIDEPGRIKLIVPRRMR